MCSTHIQFLLFLLTCLRVLVCSQPFALEDGYPEIYSENYFEPKSSIYDDEDSNSYIKTRSDHDSIKPSIAHFLSQVGEIIDVQHTGLSLCKNYLVDEGWECRAVKLTNLRNENNDYRKQPRKVCVTIGECVTRSDLTAKLGCRCIALFEPNTFSSDY